MRPMVAAGLVMLLATPALAGSKSVALCAIACNNDIVTAGCSGPPIIKTSRVCMYTVTDEQRDALLADNPSGWIPFKVWYRGKWQQSPNCDCRQFTTEETVRRRARESYISQMQERAVIEQQREMYDQMYRAHGGDE